MTTPRERASNKYRESLASLACQKGTRNGRLLGLATLGILAGRSDEQAESEIMSASGTPPLSSGEIRHALKTARRDTQPLGDTAPAARWTPLKPKPPPLAHGARDYVTRMIGRERGASLESLAACSPLPIPTESREQTQLFLKTLYDETEFLFIGQRHEAGKPGLNIETCKDWLHLYRPNGIDTEELICANPLTGKEGMTKDGKPSFRCGACVSTFLYCLAEFDGMTLADQLAFWQGVIQSDTLPLRALTFSGNKSIHGLVELDCPSAAAWGQSVETLLYAVCNPKAPPEHQADRACRNADRLTRLPGATRSDNRKAQSLLWLAPR